MTCWYSNRLIFWHVKHPSYKCQQGFYANKGITIFGFSLNKILQEKQEVKMSNVKNKAWFWRKKTSKFEISKNFSAAKNFAKVHQFCEIFQASLNSTQNLWMDCLWHHLFWIFFYLYYFACWNLMEIVEKHIYLH